MDVQLLSNWVLKVSDDMGNETFYYLATDAGNNHYIVSMLENQFSQFSDIVAYTEGDNTAAVPDAQRVDGIVKILSFDEAESLAEALRLTSEEFEDLFGKKFVDLSEDPDTIVVGAFIWVLGLSILILLLKGLAALDEFSERRKERKRAMKRTE